MLTGRGYILVVCCKVDDSEEKLEEVNVECARSTVELNNVSSISR